MRGEGYSLSDIAAATGNGNGGNGGFGGEYGAWWIIIIIILFGWGRNGNWGGGGNSDSNTVPFYQSLDTDFATIERKLDGVNNGICDSTYALNNTITNGFAAAQNTMTQGFAGLNTGMVQQGYENRIAVGNVGTQLAQCCCDLKGLLAENKYDFSQNINALNNNMNMGFTNVQQAMCLNTRDIIDNANKNYNDLRNEIINFRIQDKDAQITAQQNEINSLRLAASQSAQNEYLLNSLRNGCPVNAQLVCGNQPIPVQYITAGCGCNGNYNNGCGC